MENAAGLRVATVAARVSGPLFQEYGLYHGFEEIEIQGRSCILRLSGIRLWLEANFALHAGSGYDRIKTCHRSNNQTAASCFAKIGHLRNPSFRCGRNTNAKTSR